MNIVAEPMRARDTFPGTATAVGCLVAGVFVLTALLLFDVPRGTPVQRLGNALVFTAFTTVTLILAVWAAREWRQRGEPLLAILLLGGLLSVPGDAGARFLARLHTDPGTDHPLLYSAFGVDIALWMAPAFPAYLASFGFLTVVALREHWPRRRLWTWLIVLSVGEAAGELVMIHIAQLYVYQGNQPLRLLELPLVWPPAFVVTAALTGALMHLCGGNLPGKRALLLPIAASSYFGMLVVVSWPSMIAAHSRLASEWVTAAGLLTLILMAVVVLTIISLLRPVDAHGRAEDHRQDR